MKEAIVKDVEVKKYTYSGWVYANELTPKLCEALGLKGPEVVQVGGEFQIQWDDDIPMPEALEISVCYNGHWTLISLDEIDIYALETEIAEYEDSSWYEDAASSWADMDYDLDR